jgi:hypothetical protein
MEEEFVKLTWLAKCMIEKLSIGVAEGTISD